MKKKPDAACTVCREREAEVVPWVVLRFTADPEIQPVQARLGQPLCVRCGQGLGLDFLMPPGVFELLADEIERAGRIRPRRHLTQLQMRRIEPEVPAPCKTTTWKVYPQGPEAPPATVEAV